MRTLLLHSFMLLLLLLLLLLRAKFTLASELEDVAFVFLSQRHSLHAAIADNSRQKLTQNLLKDGVQNPQVSVL